MSRLISYLHSEVASLCARWWSSAGRGKRRRHQARRPGRNRFTPQLMQLEDRVVPSAGDLDLTFSGDGKQTVAFDLGGNNVDQATAVAIDAAGRIVVAGSAHAINSGGGYDFAVARLNPDGSLDTTFSGDGKQTVAFDLGGDNYDQAYAVALQPDGRIILAGPVTRSGSGGYDFGVARLEAVTNPTPPSARPLAATLIKKGTNKRLFVRILYADTGELIRELRSPFQKPTFKKIQVAAADTNGDSIPDTVVLTAKKGKKNVSRIFTV